MRAKKKRASESSLPAFPLPDGVELTHVAQEDWVRLTRLLPLNTGPRLLFVLVDSPTLRRRLAEHLTTALETEGHVIARVDFTTPYYQPLQEIFDVVAKHPDAHFCFLSGLERSLISSEHRVSALTDLNFHRDQISTRLSCPLVIWMTDEAFTDLANNAPDFIAWRGGVFTLADPASVLEAPYRQHLIDRFSKITLYSTTSDAPLAVDLERVFVKLTTTQRTPKAQFIFPEPVVVRLSEASAADLPPLPTLPAVSPERISRLLEQVVSEEFTATISFSDAIRSNQYLTVMGAPGAGKTTLLKYLALTFARRQATERLELNEERLPIFITLRDFSHFLDHATQHGNVSHTSPLLLPRFLNEHLKTIAPHLNLPDDFFSRQLEAGKCIVMLDGLDEIADPSKRSRVIEVIASFAPYYRGNRFILTSRPRGYEGEAQQRLSSLYTECPIRDFDDDDMAAFARSWYTAVTIDQQGDNPTARNTATAHAEDLLRAVRADERVKALARNPLLLSVLAMVHQRGVGLPQRRAELYDECTDLLLGYWDQTKGGEAARQLATAGALTRSEKRALLEPVALWFHERGEQGLEADKGELERKIAHQFTETFSDDEHKARSRAALLLQVIDERAGLLVERETGVYAFAHLTFQEYLAARAIADRDDYIDYTLQRLHDPWWREVILLEVGHLSDVRHFGRRARKLTSDLIRAIRHAGSWLEDVLKRDFLFAARCLCDTGQLGVDDELRQSLMDELITLWHTTPYEPQRQEIVDIFAYAMPTISGERIRAELLHCLDDKEGSVRLAAAGALGRMGSAAPTPTTIERLLALTADENAGVRQAAAEALGAMGSAAATPTTIERLLALTADENADVRQASAGALRKMHVPMNLIEQLSEFWQKQLEDNKHSLVDERSRRVCGIAYIQLQQLAAQRQQGAQP